ncbi:hypothetical protein EKK58_01470 [Candidatus Dependentiae bacterium]|nr:MAG: hypothetical protein EKK58_01470 [Candidatus Dependentiae bacterium]
MLQKLICCLLFFFTFSTQSHIQFTNTLHEPLLIIDIQLKKSYSVNPDEEIILLTGAQASHFLIYKGSEQEPVCSFGTVERMEKYRIVTLTTEHVINNTLPENFFLIPSSINRLQAESLIKTAPKGCSKCEERRKEREKQREKEQKKKHNLLFY